MPGRGRGRKRKTSSPLRDLPEDPVHHGSINNRAQNFNAVPRNQVIDFEQLIRESLITPGCGGNIESSSPTYGPETLSNKAPQISHVNPHSEPGTNTTSLPFNVMRTSGDGIAAHVPVQIKNQIVSGKYINMAILLKGAIELQTMASTNTVSLSKEGCLITQNQEYKGQVQSIERWTDAFLIFMAVYLTAHPDKHQDLLQYLFTIRECAARQSGYAWRTYDEQFRLRMVSCPSNPWSTINNDLWWRCMLVGDNMTTQQALSRPNNPRHKCIAFNKGQCNWPSCKFLHACSACGARHPETLCPHNQPHNTFTQCSASPDHNTFSRQRSRQAQV